MGCLSNKTTAREKMIQIFIDKIASNIETFAEVLNSNNQRWKALGSVALALYRDSFRCREFPLPGIRWVTTVPILVTRQQN